MRFDSFLKMVWKGNSCLDPIAIMMNSRVQRKKFFFSLYSPMLNPQDQL